MNTVTLNNGVEMPQMGYGVYQVSPAECERCVSDALGVGYRMIDTAQAYHNEEGVGNAVRKSGIDRKDIFLVSKVWISNYGYEKAKTSIDESLRKLQTDYIDLMLLHQPFCDRYGAYRALEEAYKEGKLGGNRSEIWQECGANRPTLVDSARCHHHPQIHPHRTDAAELGHLRLLAFR